MFKRLVICAVAVSLLSGCWPGRFTYRPGITGTIISADDGKAVVGATIRLDVPREDLVSVLAFTTGSDGTFEVEPYYRWGLDSILNENWEALGTVEIAAPGFEPHTQAVSWRGPRTQEIGIIRLAPLP
jgi:hypothetical protein